MKKKYLLITAAIGLLMGTMVWVFAFAPEKTMEEKAITSETKVPAVSAELMRTKTAIEQFKKNIEINPADHKSKLLLSLAYIQAARLTGEHPYYYPLALKLSEEVIKDNLLKDNILAYEAMVAKSSVQLSQHDFKGALNTGKQALALRTDNAAIYGVLCDANVELGNYEEAVKMSDKMAAIRPDIRSYSRISYLREIYGDDKGSMQAMNMAASAGMPGLEQTEWARTILGQLYERNGDLQNAEMQYRMTLQYLPDYSFAIAGLGRIEAKKENYDKALELFNSAAQKIPEFSFHEEIAELYLFMNKKEAAEKKAREVLEMLKEDAEAGHNSDLEVANVYAYLLGDYEEGIKYAKKEYARRPENIDVSKALAYLYYKKGDYKNASLFLKKAERTGKKEAELSCLGGMIRYKMGDTKGGMLRIKQGLEMDPFSYNALMQEGRSYLTENKI